MGKYKRLIFLLFFGSVLTSVGYGEATGAHRVNDTEANNAKTTEVLRDIETLSLRLKEDAIAKSINKDELESTHQRCALSQTRQQVFLEIGHHNTSRPQLLPFGKDQHSSQ